MKPVPKELEGIELFQRYLTTFNLINIALTNFKTVEDLMAAAPEILKTLPEYDVGVFQSLRPDIVIAAFHPKNRNVVLKCAQAQIKFWQGIIDDIKADKPQLDFWFAQGPELFRALGFSPLCTETTLVASAIYQDGCEDATDLFRSKGFADHICTANVAYPGYVMNGNWKVPHVMVKPGTPCPSSNLAYQAIKKWYGNDYIMYDSTYYLDEKGLAHQTDAIRRAIAKLEKISGQKLDEAVLRQQMKESNQTYALCGELLELRKNKPNPDPGMHRILDLLMMVTLLGEPSCTEYFQLLVDEAKERVAKGVGAIPEGKKEIRALHTWALNAYMPDLYHWLEETYGMTYLTCGLSYFVNHQVDTSSADSMVEGWAQRIMNFTMERQSMSFGDVWVDDMFYLAKNWDADCGIFAGNLSCKQGWAMSKLLGDRLEDELGIPSVRFEIELCDKRTCPPDEFKHRIGSFVETILTNSKKRV
ncbi:MAG: 2-hydroxyacyl-CoA dehydratase family protein [Thermodesulfobacteriota bacterium]|nr:MAG: 2-hydroxyacyl-CoA dehydratase family protein [Thermodesulfobacteriota bacterium]